jgi:hypothetical protein
LEEVEMMGRKLLLPAVVAVVALGLGISPAAKADYGNRAAYQVEISANPPGTGFWIWAELDPGMLSGDYQETDCIHTGHGGPNGAVHDSGSVAAWSVDENARTLTMYGVNIIGGAEAVNITVPLPTTGDYGHSYSMTMTYAGGIPIVPGTVTFPAQVQLAP